MIGTPHPATVYVLLKKAANGTLTLLKPEDCPRLKSMKNKVKFPRKIRKEPTDAQIIKRSSVKGETNYPLVETKL
jgi:hypothetical protein